MGVVMGHELTHAFDDQGKFKVLNTFLLTHYYLQRKNLIFLIYFHTFTYIYILLIRMHF